MVNTSPRHNGERRISEIVRRVRRPWGGFSTWGLQSQNIASGSRLPSEEGLPPSKRAKMGLPQTGDRPGSEGEGSTLAGLAP
jgi:hypothetical protein